ncbi:unnamed protein product [Adineta ricciae]|uniref:UBX domain-containing protein n=1 Tax=Adineta ricciae TaxID=249248 RepID=A0A815IL68_ADIRI|nr:unnamed protein product [Adineta ricciae]
MSIEFQRKHSQLQRENLGSRLTPYEKLPSIGKSNEYIPHPPLIKHSTKPNPRLRQIKQYEEEEEENEKIVLAIHLNDGKRIVKEFCSNDEILRIVKYLENQQIELPKDFYFSTGDVPKRQLKDFHLTLKQVNLQTHTMNSNESKVLLYKSLLEYSKVFLTEIPLQQSRSSSVNESISRDEKEISSTRSSFNEIDKDLLSKREDCQQRLSLCSRRKLSLLAFQDKNDKQHSKFQKFIDDSNLKRSKSLRQYQIELRDYLFKRLEGDQLKQQYDQLNHELYELDQQRKLYLPYRLLQDASNDAKSLILRYNTLYDVKKLLNDRDYQNEKTEKINEKERFKEKQKLEMTQLETRCAQLYEQLTYLKNQVNNQEQKLIEQMDLRRNRTQTISRIESCIYYLYERYCLPHQIKQIKGDCSIAEKLKTIQDFILYRIDLVNRTH